MYESEMVLVYSIKVISAVTTPDSSGRLTSWSTIKVRSHLCLENFDLEDNFCGTYDS